MTDVARHVGVSISTVSRVINGTVPVSDELRDRIVSAIRELEYRPIRAHGALNTDVMPIIAIIVPAINGPFFADHYSPTPVRNGDESRHAVVRTHGQS